MTSLRSTISLARTHYLLHTKDDFPETLLYVQIWSNYRILVPQQAPTVIYLQPATATTATTQSRQHRHHHRQQKREHFIWWYLGLLGCVWRRCAVYKVVHHIVMGCSVDCLCLWQKCLEMCCTWSSYTSLGQHTKSTYLHWMSQKRVDSAIQFPHP